MEMEGTGVTVNALLPGPTRTANTEKLRAERAKAAGKPVSELENEFFRAFRPTSLLKRFTSAEEVANMAVYICSPLASATTGAALRVEGGVVNQIM
jgi:NAD(P)-dependent dehydrogenase (short-subunit alcohol dehydrogenase family)